MEILDEYLEGIMEEDEEDEEDGEEEEEEEILSNFEGSINDDKTKKKEEKKKKEPKKKRGRKKKTLSKEKQAELDEENIKKLRKETKEKIEEVLNNSEYDTNLKKLAEEIENEIYIISNVSEFTTFRNWCYYYNFIVIDKLIILDKNSTLNKGNLPISVKKFFKGKITAKQLISFRHDEIYIKIWKNEVEEYEIKKEEFYKDHGTGGEGVKCRRCGERNCKISFAQERSADEGETCRITCPDCGNCVKIN